MPLPSRDELRERLAAVYEAAGVTAGDAISKIRRTFEERPQLGRAFGIGAAVVVFAGVVIGVVVGQRGGPQPASGGQLLVPAVTSTPRAEEQDGTPTVGSPPHPGAPPDPGTPAEHPSRKPRAAPPASAAASPTGTAAHSAAAPGVPPDPAIPGEHRVASGETLAQIALRYDVPFEQIAADSGIGEPSRVRPGQRLVIRAKPAGVEVIQPGRTLGDYARSSGRRVDELMRLNPQLTDPDRILAGGRLNV
ncbi:MAG: rane-bound lytic murein transglycosylase [Pseudonocardiales bacterium]|jgi:LysM repeat protein|nr:rane-bound lytic murein transglycosylase [Pseudonocardiales bacterium]